MLRLSPNRHSAKLLPHHHTSYVGLAILLVMAAICMVLLTLAIAFPGSADSGSMTVNAVVPGPPPASAPTITNPSNNTQVSSQQLTVSGSCSAGLTVVLTDDSVARGSTICSNGGGFSLVITLASGSNALAAYHLDDLNQPGPNSPTVTVIYQASGTASPVSAAAAPTTPSASTPTSGVSQQFSVTAPNRFDAIQSGQNFALHGNLENGTPPYAVQVDWGDHTQALLSRAIVGPFTLQHSYAVAGRYIIKLTASDAAGLASYYQTTAVVDGVAALSPTPSHAASPTAPAYKLLIIWPLFLVICLAVGSFWLGERYDRRRTGDATPPPATS